MSKNIDLLNWIQNWFYSNCNGDWEHNRNIVIENLDNPGWGLTIKLQDTKLESKSFKIVNVEKDENNWYYCRVKESTFEGAGGALNLGDLLEVFKNWVDDSTTENKPEF